MYNHRVLKRCTKEDPLFIRRVFVAHYCNIPYNDLLDNSKYPRTLIDELFIASQYLMRNHELAPYTDDKGVDAILQKRFDSGELE